MSPYKGNILHILPCPDTSTYPIPSQTDSHIYTHLLRLLDSMMYLCLKP
jgi:hypothetical protein